MSNEVKTYQELLKEIESLKLENAELKSADYEDIYRQSFEGHTAIILIIDPADGKIYDANYAAADYYGWSREELRSMKIQQINISPAGTILNEMNKAKEHKKSRFEFKHKLANGSIRDVDVLSVGISGLTGKEYLHSIVFDITDRKQAEISLKKSEARLSQAELVSKCGNWELHLDSQMITASSGAEEIYGLHGTQFAYKTIKNARLPEDSSKMDSGLKNLIENGEPYDIEYRIKNAESGATIYVHSVAEYDKERRIIFGVVQDITGRKQREEKLKIALKEKEVLLRELYHRTKNNMQVVYSLLGLKGAAFEDKATKEILMDVGNRIKAIALVHEKLYQSKNLSRIDLKDYITDLAALLLQSYNSTAKKINLTLELESLNVLIDTAIPCGQIIVELISNSCKHAFPDGRDGIIFIHLSKNEKDIIKLSISDNGIGMPDYSEVTRGETLGMQLFKTIVEGQLQGNINYNMENGVSWTVSFKDVLYDERVTC